MPIFDQGYQHWSGQLSGHAWRWLAVTQHGVRVALASRWIKLLLVVAMLPAIVLATVLCLWGLLERQSELIASILPFLTFLDKPILAGPKDFRVEIWTVCYSYFLYTEMWLSMVMILLVGPNLISQDLRYNALPLYFSRPLRRIDYFLGKLGVVAAFLGMMMVVPAVAAYVLGILFSLDITILRDTWRILVASVVFGLLVSMSAGTLILALSSLSRNSRYVALMWLGVWFMSGMVATILLTVNQVQTQHEMRRPGQRMGPLDMAPIELAAAKSNWRPLVGYTANLARIGDQLLGTTASFERIGNLRPEKQRDLLLFMTMRRELYPWYWSAGVLAVLFGISACILNLSIKSLDRLK